LSTITGEGLTIAVFVLTVVTTRLQLLLEEVTDALVELLPLPEQH
jgi:hypothetical protein